MTNIEHKVMLILTDVEAELIATSAAEQQVPVAEFVRRSAITMALTLKPKTEET